MINYTAGTVLAKKVNAQNNFVEEELDCSDINAVALTGTQTISGTKTFNSDITTLGNFVLASIGTGLKTNTTPGSDTSYSTVMGAGTMDTNRGAEIKVFGNQNINFPGYVQLTCGNTANAKIQLKTVGNQNIEFYTNDTKHWYFDGNSPYGFCGNSTINYIGTDTVDGSDNKAIYICGGGFSTSSVRGGGIEIYGNEYAGSNAGIVRLTGGGVTSGHVSIITNGSDAFIQLSPYNPSGVGQVRFYPNGRIIYSNTNAGYCADTVDGSDTKSFCIAGGGNAAVSRGATLYVYGNEHTTYSGLAQLESGDSTNANLILRCASAGGSIQFKTGGSNLRWIIDSNGHYLPQSDNTLDIGSSSYRVRNIYAGSEVTVSGSPGSPGIKISRDSNYGYIDSTGNNDLEIRRNGVAKVTINSTETIIRGDLNVSGTINYINTEDLLVEDNNIILNSTWSGTPTENASIIVERGSSNDAQIQWNESTDYWSAGISGSLQKVILQADLDAAISGLDGDIATLSGYVDSQDAALSGYVNTQDAAAVTSGQSYTNSQIASYSGYAEGAFVNVSGDTMAGFLTLHSNPTASGHAVTKQYVDSISTGISSIGVINAQTKSANGAVISGTSLYMQTADSSYPGLMSTGVQTIAGNKTFTGSVFTSNMYGNNNLNLYAASGSALYLGVSGTSARMTIYSTGVWVEGVSAYGVAHGSGSGNLVSTANFTMSGTTLMVPGTLRWPTPNGEGTPFISYYTGAGTSNWFVMVAPGNIQHVGNSIGLYYNNTSNGLRLSVDSAGINFVTTYGQRFKMQNEDFLPGTNLGSNIGSSSLAFNGINVRDIKNPSGYHGRILMSNSKELQFYFNTGGGDTHLNTLGNQGDFVPIGSGQEVGISTLKWDRGWFVNGISNFTGEHLYQCKDGEDLQPGEAVKLVNNRLERCNTEKDPSCVGILDNFHNTNPDNFKIKTENDILTDSLLEVVPSGAVLASVAAVGDNYTGDNQGFRVCSEGGNISVGDYLCTASGYPGHLKKQDDDLMHNYTVGKALQSIIFTDSPTVSGIYGFLYCG